MNTIVLFRPVGKQELDLIEESGWRKFPPRLPEQPIFYPVMNEEYAIQIQNVGGEIHNELWAPAEELDEFNNHIVGLIEVTKKYYKEEK